MSCKAPAVLIIAGSDSSGGAGLQRDLKVLADFNVRAVTAITAVTAQTDCKMISKMFLPPNLVRNQIISAIRTCTIGAVKIGMLGTAPVVEVVAECLRELDRVPIIGDPVLKSTSGSLLLDAPGQLAMRHQLFPMLTLVTPNMPEAAALLGEVEAENYSELLEQAQRLMKRGPRAVLLKGGHSNTDKCNDILVQQGQEPVCFAAERLPASMRGSGCALSTAIAAVLTREKSLMSSCLEAKLYVTRQMQN